MPNVIQNRIAFANRPYCEYDVSSGGFELIIVLDISSSMSCSKKSIETLFATMTTAIKDLKELDLKVFAFNQLKNGITNVYTVSSKRKGLFGGDMNISGTTPIPQAMYMCKELINTTNGKKKSVLMIGDGFPVFSNRKGEAIETENLMQSDMDVLQHGILIIIIL